MQEIDVIGVVSRHAGIGAGARAQLAVRGNIAGQESQEGLGEDEIESSEKGLEALPPSAGLAHLDECKWNSQ